MCSKKGINILFNNYPGHEKRANSHFNILLPVLIRIFHFMRILGLLIPVILFQNCNAQRHPEYEINKDNNSLLWEVTGNGIRKPTYLFGTFHLMCKDDIRIGTNLKSIIQHADEVYFEMDLDDPANTFGALLVMNMKDGKRLRDFYTPDQYEKLSAFFKDSLNTPFSMMERMKPLFLQALLYPKLLACSKTTGMEEELMKLAKAHGKEIKGFETIAFQASVFDSIPYDVQAKELLKSIDSIQYYQEEFDSLVNIYRTQDLTKMEEAMKSSMFADSSMNSFLLDQRNINWVEIMQPILQEKGLFIAVGAGHLPGKMGVLNLLRQKGYTVRPVLNN